MAEKELYPMVGIPSGEVKFRRADELKKTMERYGLVYEDWRVVMVEPYRIYFLLKGKDNTKEITMKVLPREVT